MACYVIRDLDSVSVKAFRTACRNLSLKPNTVLSDFMKRACLDTSSAEATVTVDLRYPRPGSSAHG